jgi:hypothetical protein
MKKQVNSQLYELEKVRFIIKDACDIDVGYAYDDLVFAEHGLFLIQFLDQAATKLACWFNNEMPESQEIRMFDSLAKTASLNNAVITYKGRFMMKQKSGSEEINIEFVDMQPFTEKV